ncbi:hypothetical protein F5882DRAFT_70486 [Hyaloscypha sp. PMI_1271]|nr:hypothetical protein F5882DRAFT_70486 [Hyaloscypha sp. PMI_1271]
MSPPRLSPKWLYTNSLDAVYVLKYHRHHLPELAEYITAGFLTGFICQLLIEKGWGNHESCLVSSTNQRIRRIYANFVRQEATKRLDERSFVYGRKTERDFKERIKEHSQGTKEAKTKGKGSHHHMFCVRGDFIDDGFCILAVYGKGTHPANYELAEGFTIVELGPYESRPFLDLTSQFQLLVVADSYDRHLSLGLNQDPGMMPWGDFSTTP